MYGVSINYNRKSLHHTEDVTLFKYADTGLTTTDKYSYIDLRVS